MSSILLVTNGRQPTGAEKGYVDAVYSTKATRVTNICELHGWAIAPPYKVILDFPDITLEIVQDIELVLGEYNFTITKVWSFHYNDKSIGHPTKEELMSWIQEIQQ